MQRLVFWLIYPFLWMISLLPFKLFYIFSDFVFIWVFYVIGYRKKTVLENLERVFPEKSPEERKRIRRKFYRHMVDMFLEMIKSISITEEELKKRFAFTNLEVIQDFRQQDKSLLLACGHYASYEWMNALQLYGLDYTGFGIYKKVKNPYFDNLARKIRGRYNGILIPTTEAKNSIRDNEKKAIRGVYAMIADQSPRLDRARSWANFMGSLVPVFTGTERLAKSLDMPVVYLHVEKIGRGYYVATFKTISDQPAQEAPHFITRKYFDELEAQIYSAPEFYLWTHKRWKHARLDVPSDAELIRRT